MWFQSWSRASLEPFSLFPLFPQLTGSGPEWHQFFTGPGIRTTYVTYVVETNKNKKPAIFFSLYKKTETWETKECKDQKMTNLHFDDDNNNK